MSDDEELEDGADNTGSVEVHNRKSGQIVEVVPPPAGSTPPSRTPSPTKAIMQKGRTSSSWALSLPSDELAALSRVPEEDDLGSPRSESHMSVKADLPTEGSGSLAPAASATRESGQFAEVVEDAVVLQDKSARKEIHRLKHFSSDSRIYMKMYVGHRCCGRRCCRVPHGTHWFWGRWDFILFLGILYTAIFTPFEVAFLGTYWQFTESSLALAFWINRAVDLVFFTDMCINFVRPFALSEEDEDRLNYETRIPQIACHYLETSFFIDVLATVPWDILAIIIAYQSGVGNLQQLKLARGLRVLKLFRMFRASKLLRILEPWQNRLRLRFSHLALVKFLAMVFFSMHWMACLWMSSTLLAGPDEETWISSMDPEVAATVGQQYMLALYWSIMTLSTIGYGDITPVSQWEYIIASICMLLGASFWAYIIAMATQTLSTLNQEANEFNTRMDDLDEFMNESNFKLDLRMRLREFLTRSRSLLRQETYRKLIETLSPELQAEVSQNTNSQWLKKVSYFQNASDDFVMVCSLAVEHVLYAPLEWIPGESLHVIRRGVVAYKSKVLLAGRVFGDDMILDNPKLRSGGVARALTYVELARLSRRNLDWILGKFPLEARKVAQSKIKLAVRRWVIREWRREQAEKKRMLRRQDPKRSSIGSRCRSRVKKSSLFAQGKEKESTGSEGAPGSRGDSMSEQSNEDCDSEVSDDVEREEVNDKENLGITNLLFALTSGDGIEGGKLTLDVHELKTKQMEMQSLLLQIVQLLEQRLPGGPAVSGPLPVVLQTSNSIARASLGGNSPKHLDDTDDASPVLSASPYTGPAIPPSMLTSKLSPESSNMLAGHVRTVSSEHGKHASVLQLHNRAPRNNNSSSGHGSTTEQPVLPPLESQGGKEQHT
eukprot:g65566.t1